jgi:hypothetical protein
VCANRSSMGKAQRKVTKVRSNGVYVQKLLKRHQTRAVSDVVSDLDKMITFILNKTTNAMAIVATSYDKKLTTVKPKLAQAAFQSILDGDLRMAACEAGAAALERYCASKKGATAEEPETEAAVESAA